MPKPRKTIPVAPLVDALNVAIQAKAGHKEEQGALCWAIEKILMDANAYRGFGWRKGTVQLGAVNFDDPDYFCRNYYIDASLRVNN